LAALRALFFFFLALPAADGRKELVGFRYLRYTKKVTISDDFPSSSASTLGLTAEMDDFLVIF
jgi:hypothetical protein